MPRGQLEIPAGLRALDRADSLLEQSAHTEQALGIPKLARRVGVSNVAIYRYFDSQLGFLAALAARQWERATAALELTDGSVMELAMADISFAIDNPHRFRLMYDHQLWTAVSADEDPDRPREVARLEELEAARNENFARFVVAMGGDGNNPKVRLVAALLTGLSFEFVNNEVYPGQPHRQRQHAAELLGLVLG